MTGDMGGIIAPDKIVDKDAQVHDKEGITPVGYGLDEEALQLLADGLYNKPLEIARGTPVCNGVDGSIKELFPREIKPTFKEREDGTINFKEMNLVVNVEEGQTLCEITLPTGG